MFQWAKTFTVQQATVVLWQWLAYVAMLLGILPVRGWPLNPRPLALPVALSLSVGFYAFLVISLLLRVGLDFNTTRKHSDTNKVVTLIWLACTGISSLTAIKQRHGLVQLVSCLKTYGRRHPLSSYGWWILLFLTVSRLEVWIIVAVTDLSMPGTVRSPSMLEGVLVAVFVSVLWPLLSCLLYLGVVCPVGILGALAADLREESIAVIRHWTSFDRPKVDKMSEHAAHASTQRGVDVLVARQSTSRSQCASRQKILTAFRKRGQSLDSRHRSPGRALRYNRSLLSGR
ncbi:uncharacterized protein LOC117648251 [Thrips palmi]|uniref:Uncharacterized protein LOC117648251 n=1 Tax=Thrips palmi TaxID=161013 RepID=A0A6P8Z7Z8_THRPL|nr:uncharacterized protein LOC117648251 [Thrips palmi]